MGFRDNGGPAPAAAVGTGTTLAELRKQLPPGQRSVVKQVMAHMEREVIESFPELNDGVQTSAAEGSISLTLQVKAAKNGNFKGTVSTRVRSPREPLQIDMHMGDDNQLALGLPDPDPDQGEGEAGSATE